MKKFLWGAAVFVLSVVLAYSAWRIFGVFSEYRRASDTYEEARRRFVTTLNPQETEPQGEAPGIGRYFAEYDPAEAEEGTEETSWRLELPKIRDRAAAAGAAGGTLQEYPEPGSGQSEMQEHLPEAWPEVTSGRNGSSEGALSGEDDPEAPEAPGSGTGADESLPEELCPAGRPVPLLIDWEGLRTVNRDIAGWIYVEALPQISYPVLQGKDDSYYVYRTYDGEESRSGCIFMSTLCARDFSASHSVVYGHNMNDGTMFSPLYAHRGDGTFLKNPYIWILTPEGAFCYRIFSVFETARSSDAFTVFLEGSHAFLEHAYGLMARGSFYRDTGVLPSTESKIISLVTCVPEIYNRTVISAVRVASVQTDSGEGR